MSDPQRPEREAIERLRVLLEQATPISDAKLIRYDHGGGRYYSAVKRSVDEALYSGEEHRTLIADFYHEADRELFVLLRELAPDLLAALPPTPTPGWQPMETAPKDGTVILLASELGTEPVRWNKRAELWDMAFGVGYVGRTRKLFGWQPLPPAPTGDRS
jgi:hypothetical protein